MSRYRWCGFCNHAFHECEIDEDEYGLPACPYCGAPGMYLRAWNAVRTLYQGIPEEPVSGERYRLGDRPAVPSIAAAASLGVGPIDESSGVTDPAIG